jgi:hypothetical protein
MTVIVDHPIAKRFEGRRERRRIGATSYPIARRQTKASSLDALHLKRTAELVILSRKRIEIDVPNSGCQ